MKKITSTLTLALALAGFGLLTACPDDTPPAGTDAAVQHDAGQNTDASIADAQIVDHQQAGDSASQDDAALPDAAVESDSAVDQDSAISDTGVSEDATQFADAGTQEEDLAMRLCRIKESGFYRILIASKMTQDLSCDPQATMDWDGNSTPEPLADYVAEHCIDGKPWFDFIKHAVDAHHIIVGDGLQACLDQGAAYRASHNTVLAYQQSENVDLDTNCSDLIHGTQQEGDVCEIGWECADGLFCDYQSADNSFRCQAGANAGEACFDIAFQDKTRHCADGLACISDVCVQPAEAGGACDDDKGCQDGYYCKSQVCTRYGLVDDNCSDTECAKDLYCKSADQLCHAKEAQDASCDVNDDACGTCLFCRKSNETADYQCLPLAAENAYCEDDSECLPSLYCDANQKKCLARKAATQPCSDDRQCQMDLKCANNVCSEKDCKDRGDCQIDEACDDYSDCAEGLACKTDTNTCAVKPSVGQSCALVTTCDDDSYCESETCVAKKAAGENCSDNEQCTSNICNTDQGLCTPKSGGCMFEKKNFGLFVFFGLLLAPLRRRFARR